MAGVDEYWHRQEPGRTIPKNIPDRRPTHPKAYGQRIRKVTRLSQADRQRFKIMAIEHPPTMKTTTPPEPLCTLRVTNLGYSIAIIPATAADRTEFLVNAPRRGMSLRDFCQDQIPDAMVFAAFET
jgi:hypothetical protein